MFRHKTATKLLIRECGSVINSYEPILAAQGEFYRLQICHSRSEADRKQSHSGKITFGKANLDEYQDSKQTEGARTKGKLLDCHTFL